jgi:adenosylcobinamide-GDP ribazoletransferase
LDTADAFLGAGDKDRKLAILKDSRIGVYAFFAGFVYLAAKLAFLAFAAAVALDAVGLVYGRMIGAAEVLALSNKVPVPGVDPLQSNLALLVAFFAYPLAGRLAAALVPCVLSSIRPGGLGSLASDSRPGRALGGNVVAFLAYLCIGLPLVLFSGVPVGISVWIALSLYIVLLLSALAALLFVARVYKKGVGGYTGDTLGAAVELGELVHIVIVCLSFFVVVRLA